MIARAAAVSCAFALLVGACRSGIGEPCRCGSDCRSGLACFLEGAGEKEGNACHKAGVRGECLPPTGNDGTATEGALPDMPVYEDLPSRRDLAPGTGGESAGGTTGGTTDGTGTATGATTDATTGTSTTDATTGTTTTSTTTTSTT
ncbi:MAG TPA: hypothetical protein VIK91_24905, partial [Nannocystis sp.]